MRNLSALLLAAALPAMLALPVTVQAEEQQSQSQQKTRKTPAMREKVYDKLAEAQAFAETDQEAEALKVLDALSRTKDLNSYELAQIYNFYGFIYFSQEKYTEAAKAYENMLAQPDLPEALETSTYYTLSQLYFVAEDYRKAIDMLNRWFAVAINPGAEAYVLLGQAYYQIEEYQQAIGPVETAIAINREAGRTVKENWWLLLRTFYYELNNYPKMLEILEHLLRDYPKKEYWLQVSGVYGELGRDTRQLIAYEMAYMQGFLERGRELETMAQLYLQADVPYKAALVLEEGFKSGAIEVTAASYRLLSQAWMMAREDEKAIPPLREAAQRTGDGELDVRLAQSYFNLDQYAQAADSAREAMSKGGLDREDTAAVLLGMSLYNLDRYEQAKDAFRVAQRDQRSSRMASQWIAHISKEQEREAGIRRAIGN